jgi:hypothetical protein
MVQAKAVHRVTVELLAEFVVAILQSNTGQIFEAGRVTVELGIHSQELAALHFEAENKKLTLKPDIINL